jgi:hypothetical protein
MRPHGDNEVRLGGADVMVAFEVALAELELFVRVIKDDPLLTLVDVDVRVVKFDPLLTLFDMDV